MQKEAQCCMKKKLAEIFKDKCITGVIPDDAGKYYWYLDEKNKPIGISKEISHIEQELIELNYISVGINNLADTEKLLWLNFLVEGEFSGIPVNATGTTTTKFIFFFHDFDTDLKLEFESLVKGFNSSFKVLFFEAEYGVILDLSKASNGEDHEVEDFLLASKQDFSSKLTFYQTINYEINSWLPEKFKTELDLFKKFKDTNLPLMKCKDIFLNYMISIDVVAKHPIFGEWFKQIFLIDAELLAVVKCYLENGFNVTTGARVMHMHRNTFMNKLDRFIDVTGLDVKNFDEAAIAYLLIRTLRVRAQDSERSLKG